MNADRENAGKMGKSCLLHDPVQRWVWEYRTAPCPPTQLPRKTEASALVTYHVCIMLFISLYKLVNPCWAAFQHGEDGHYSSDLGSLSGSFQKRLKKLSNLGLRKAR